MKKIGVLLLLCCILVCSVCGCANDKSEKTALNYVNLCDYKSLNVPQNEYIVSEADIDTAIQLQLASYDIDSSQISDEIAITYLHCDSISSAKEMFKREIIENRFYESARDIIFNSSKIIEFPEESDKYVNDIVSTQKILAEEEGISLNEYFKKYYEMTEEEFREATLWSYADILILKGIAEQEKYQITSEERASLIDSTAKSIGMTTEETVKIYGEEYFDCILYENFLKDLIINIYTDEILNAMKL